MFDFKTAAVITSALVSMGAVLIYVGRSLRTLQQVDANQTDLFRRINDNEKDIASVDKRLAHLEGNHEARTKTEGGKC